MPAIPKSPFNPANWYWIVAGSATQVYSSAGIGYVPVADSTYQAWLAAGNAPTKIAVEQDLWDLLTAAGVAIPVSATVSDTQKTALLNALPGAQLKLDFNHENRIRVLEGRVALTFPQFIAAFKTLL